MVSRALPFGVLGMAIGSRLGGGGLTSPPVAVLTLRRRLDPADLARVRALLDAAEAVDGRRALDDLQWIELQRGGGDGFAAVLAAEGDATGETDETDETDEGDVQRPLLAYAQVSPSNDAWSMEVVVHPDHRGHAGQLVPQVVEAAIGAVRQAGGGTVHWWVADASDDDAALATAAGFTPGRTLLQMRVPLPLDEQPTVAVRPFRVGGDEAAWLEVNNLAFAGHPEQGGWDLSTLQARMAEPWFDVRGFLVHEVDGRLAAFNWTKLHLDEDPPLGEIYVIAVHPDFAGRGLGRALAVAGLASIAERGVHVGMLYVDADNAAARGLYESLGFTVHRVDRAFVRQV